MSASPARQFITLLTIGLALATPARAHSFPEAQNPSAGETLSAAPSDVTITYDAPIEKLFAQLQVVGGDGKNETVGEPQVGADGRTLSAKVAPLGPGDYTVRWSVVCVDTHHTQGSYQFTVASGAR